MALKTSAGEVVRKAPPPLSLLGALGNLPLTSALEVKTPLHFLAVILYITELRNKSEVLRYFIFVDVVMTYS